MHTVKASEGVEARAKQAGGEAEPFVVERSELIHLATNKGRPEERGDRQPQVGAPIVTFLGS